MGDFGAHHGQARRHAFISDARPDRVAQSLTPEMAVTSVDRVGDHQEVTGTFVPTGRAVAATVNPPVTYGGADGVVSDAILAEYDPATGEVYPLNTLQQRDPNTKPWIVGKNIELLADPRRKAKGAVIRGNLVGDAGFDAHVFIAGQDPAGPSSFQVILHHEQPNPPQNSTLAYDPDGKSGRVAPLSDALRIRGGLDVLCPGQTGTKPEPIWWTYINGTKHGGPRVSGWFGATFAEAEALFSAEVYGPLRPASVKHEFGITHEGRSHRVGAIQCDALFTRGNPQFDAPLEIEDVEEPDVQDPEGHPQRVHLQHDKDVKHRWMCKPGSRDGLRRWHKKEPVAELPPCKGAKKTAPPAYAVLPQLYFVGGHLSGGYGFLSHPGA